MNLRSMPGALLGRRSIGNGRAGGSTGPSFAMALERPVLGIQVIVLK
jgi:hypothetical protein